MEPSYSDTVQEIPQTDWNFVSKLLCILQCSYSTCSVQNCDYAPLRIWLCGLGSSPAQAIKNVHKFALRVCSKQWRASYESLLTTFHAFSMSERRVQLKLLTLFNMVNGNILLPSSPLQPRNIPYAIRHANQHQLTLPLYRTNSFKHSFFPSAITYWNNLPFDTTELSSPAMFKRLVMQL